MPRTCGATIQARSRAGDWSWMTSSVADEQHERRDRRTARRAAASIERLAQPGKRRPTARRRRGGDGRWVRCPGRIRRACTVGSGPLRSGWRPSLRDRRFRSGRRRCRLTPSATSPVARRTHSSSSRSLNRQSQPTRPMATRWPRRRPPAVWRQPRRRRLLQPRPRRRLRPRRRHLPADHRSGARPPSSSWTVGPFPLARPRVDAAGPPTRPTRSVEPHEIGRDARPANSTPLGTWPSSVSTHEEAGTEEASVPASGCDTGRGATGQALVRAREPRTTRRRGSSGPTCP